MPLLLSVVACSPGVGSGSTAQAPSGSEAAAVGTDVEGRFRLTLTLPRSSWRSNEPIDGTARLMLTEGAATTLHGSGSGMIAFSFREIGGTRSVGPAVPADCASHPIAPEAPIVSPIVKSGAWADSDPNAAFYRAFLNDPLVRLPAGDWDIVVIAEFGDGATCTASPFSLETSVRVHVTE